MKGFKDSTKTQYERGGPTGTKGAAKVSKVMREFKSGELHSGSKSGPPVNSRKQAVAIALSESRKAVKKADGGSVSARPTDSRGRRASDFDLGLNTDEAAVEGGNRDPYERTPPREMAVKRPRSVTVERTTVSNDGYKPTALDRTLSAKPRRGPAGAGYDGLPLVDRIRNAIGLKKGGLAAMPRK